MPVEYFFTKKTAGFDGPRVPRTQVNDEFCWIMGVKPDSVCLDPNFCNLETALVFSLFGTGGFTTEYAHWDSVRVKCLSDLSVQNKGMEPWDCVRLDAAFRYLAAHYELHAYRTFR